MQTDAYKVTHDWYPPQQLANLFSSDNLRALYC